MSGQLGNGSYTRDYATAASSRDAKGGYPRFFLETVKDERASVEANRPIFFDVEMVEIIIPSIAQYNKPIRRVRDEDKERWPKEYEAFKKGQEMPLDGTPLEEWNVLTKSALYELKSFGFRTIEDVSEMTEHAVQRLGMAGRPLKLKAVAYLSEADRTRIANSVIEANEKLQSQLADRDVKIQNLQEQVDAMGKHLHTLLDNRAPNVNSPTTTHVPPMSVEPERRSALAAFAMRPDPIARQEAQRGELAAFDKVGPLTPSGVENLVTKRKPGRPPRGEAAA